VIQRKRSNGDVGNSSRLQIVLTRDKKNCTNLSVISMPREINLDELSYDPADRKRIPEYTKKHMK
jgi:hypothetical protein